MKTAAIGAGPRTARKLAPVLERTIFRTSRLAEFCSTRELVAQTGHQIAEWSLVTLKELTDNAIDICEEKDIAPEIAVSVSTEEGTITVADNGPAIPPQTIIDVLDYSVRVSSREAYVSPTRGAQGNALQTLLVMGFALDSQEPVETNSVVGPEVQQSPSGQVISESYRGSEHALPDPKNCMVAARANVGFHKY